MSKISKSSITFTLLLTAISCQVIAETSCKSPAGRFASIEGNVKVLADGTDNWQAAKNKASLCKGDTIRVGELSRAAVALANEAVLRLDQNTTMRLVNIAEKKEEKSFIQLVEGAIKAFIRKPRLLSVNTPYLNGSIEGTEFQVSVKNESASILVLEGRILASNEYGKVSIKPSEFAEAKKGAAPTSKILVNPRDAVQWSLYYPSVISTASNISELNKTANNQRDADFYVKRATLYLNVGRHKKALNDINKALKLDANSGLAYAMQSVLYVVANENDKALEAANKAVSLSDTSSSRIALSYALQANFEIAAARDAMLAAVNKNSQDALAWARLSELWLMLGNKEQSTIAATKATEIEPNNARTQQVLGFAALAEFNSTNAQEIFEKAIAKNSSDPMAHLGLGLAKISQGQLTEGRSEIEVAVALDSNNALLRAYLGKAYFEEARAPLDAQQFEIAKQLDPNDPTAFLYDGIRKQSETNPVGALQDINQSIALNDNRAVYRSRLLLDSDNAARGTNLAQVYTDLGFEKLALIEGTKSVNADPTNASAHRFLSDSYAALPRHEIARVSELLQSQLLNPLNTTPIQASLAETQLLLMSTSGPAGGGFNEFNSLFNRDNTHVYLAGMAGSNSTSGGEVVVANISGNTVFSAGISQFKTDGWRANADQDDTIANLFWQTEFSSDTSIQAEYRSRENEWGDTLLRFFPANFYTGVRNDVEEEGLRIGARHNLAPNSIILASLYYQDNTTNLVDSAPAFPATSISFNVPQTGSGAEVQHLYTSEENPDYNLVSGVGYADIDGEINFNGQFVSPPFPVPTVVQTTPTIIKHSNIYSYGNFKPASSVNMTVGVSMDSLTGELPGGDRDQVNPKLGLSWEASNASTLRLAAFRTLKRTLVINQTLEPTQIAGFNQFYDDLNLTDSRVVGLGFDHKFSNRLYSGLEYTGRDLVITYTSQIPPFGALETDWEERVARAYLYWTPMSEMSFKLAYNQEETTRGADYNEGLFDLNTKRLSLGVKYFLPKALSLSLDVSQVEQEGDVRGPITPPATGDSQFTLVDAAVNYRLPSRKGAVSVGAKNLLDEDFKYFDLDLNNASIQPGRMVFVKITYML